MNFGFIQAFPFSAEIITNMLTNGRLQTTILVRQGFGN
jgi:hypothetical protein